MLNDEALKEELLETSDEFRRLHEEHQSCERRLDDINQKSLLSQEDEIEAKKLKLHKLALKDQMQAMMRDYHAEHVSA